MKAIFSMIFLLMTSLLSLISQTNSETISTNKQSDNHEFNSFIYHRFGEDKYPFTNITKEQFEQHLQFLSEHNYTVMNLGEALKRIYNGKGVPEKTVVLTIDDGFESIKTVAAPLLKQYGYTATIFVCTKYIGNSSYLTWNEVRELQQDGYEIGNHSHSHAHFLNYSSQELAEQFKNDLDKSHSLFRKHLGKIPDLYAYPYGEYNDEMTSILKSYNYKAGAAQKSGVIYSGTEKFHLPRFPMTSMYARIERFKEKARMHPLPVIKQSPSASVPRNDNPPVLTFHVNTSEINSANLQCFVAGTRNCTLTKKINNNELVIRMQAEHKLTSRRTLYTITAPSKEGNEWYWFSHLWVMPKYPEYGE